MNADRRTFTRAGGVLALLVLAILAVRAEADDLAPNRILVKTGALHYDVNSRLPRHFDRFPADEWDIAQEVEYQRMLSPRWGLSAVLAYAGDVPAVTFFAMTFPVGLLLSATDDLPFTQVWYVNHTQGRYWVELVHYAATALGWFEPVSVRLVSGEGPQLRFALGAGGGVWRLEKKLRSRTGKQGSLAGPDRAGTRPGGAAAARLGVVGGRFGVSLEYKFQYVPPLRDVNPRDWDYDVSGSLVFLNYQFEF